MQAAFESVVLDSTGQRNISSNSIIEVCKRETPGSYEPDPKIYNLAEMEGRHLDVCDCQRDR